LFDSWAHDFLKNESSIAKPITDDTYLTKRFYEYSPFFAEVQKFLRFTKEILVSLVVYNYSKSIYIAIELTKRYLPIIKPFTPVKSPSFKKEKSSVLFLLL